MKRNRLIVGAFDVFSFVLVAGVLSLAWITPAYAYVDPSVMTYTIQALAGVAVALSAVLGVALRRTRKVLFKMLKIDENAGKVVEAPVHRLDKDGKPVPDGEAGEICVRGSGLASGYFGNWEKTNECFIQNPANPYFRDILYRTGDIAVKKDDGLLYFLSRQDGQIKHMGYRIELGEIETALHSVDGIAAAACLFDRNRDRIVCIYEGEPDAAALARAMRRLVPKYMLPNIYEKLDALPMNANGKIDRVKLKEQFIHAED